MRAELAAVGACDIPDVAGILSAAAGAVVVQHEGADDVAQHEAVAAAQHEEEADEQQPQACAGVAANAPTEVIANTIESNLIMQISFIKPRGNNTHYKIPGQAKCPTGTPRNYVNLLTTELTRIALRQRPQRRRTGSTTHGAGRWSRLVRIHAIIFRVFSSDTALRTGRLTSWQQFFHCRSCHIRSRLWSATVGPHSGQVHTRNFAPGSAL